MTTHSKIPTALLHRVTAMLRSRRQFSLADEVDAQAAPCPECEPTDPGNPPPPPPPPPDPPGDGA